MPGNAGGNTRDNRQRGNAAQLLEKYKSMARDAQLAGDRVQTEYYLQFADHYFRVLEENRARFEDQQPRRGRGRDDEDDDGEEMMADDAGGEEDGEEESRAPQRRDRGRPRSDRDERPRQDRFERQDEDRPRRERPHVEATNDEQERIPLGVLPPAIGIDDSEVEEAAPAPRRRARKPRAEGGEGVAPAA